MIDINNAVLNIEEISSYRVRRFETLSEFLIYATVLEPERFRSYCEIIIACDGSIIYPINTGHTYILEWLTGYSYEELHNIPKEDERINCYDEWLLERTKAVSVWYDFQRISVSCIDDEKLNETLDRLEEAKLIRKNIVPIRSYTELCEMRKGSAEKDNDTE